MAGYSGTPLLQKIGIRAGNRLILHNHPATFLRDLGDLPEGVEHADRPLGKANVIVCFTDRRADLEKQFPVFSGKLVPDGMLWISWPKKSSGLSTDLTENVVREVGLNCGLVDVKVCAIDDIWSGLKFVYRSKDRPAAVKTTEKKLAKKKK